MSRQENRSVAAELRKRSKTFPEHLEPVDRSEWPERREGQVEYPYAVWRSRMFLVQVYEAPLSRVGRVIRISVNRVYVNSDGKWSDGITWDELQRVKREIGFGDRWGFEIYPGDQDVVNVANMRHLWILVEPLDIGWFAT